MLAEKIESAIELIKNTITSDSIVLSSFGKDSMVLLDLMKQAEFKLPILFFKEPFYPKKYSFANKVILANNYTVYDYPPLYSTIIKGKDGDFEIINNHQIGGPNDKTIYWPTGIVSPNSTSSFLCGLKDIYNKPKGTFQFIWNTLFIGHKSSDIDPILEHIQLKTEVFAHEGKTFVYPLKDFTDKDIWDYHEKYQLPINHKRYDKNNNWKEFKDYTYNPDYFPACVACMDKDNPKEVLCLKLNTVIPNISKHLNYATPDLSHYVMVQKGAA